MGDKLSISFSKNCILMLSDLRTSAGFRIGTSLRLMLPEGESWLAPMTTREQGTVGEVFRMGLKCRGDRV